MDNTKTLNVVIKAVDDASAQLEAVKSKTAELSGQTESMATSVFKGAAAWDLLKEGLRMAKDFMVDAISASAKASAEMAIVKTNITNAGMSFEEISPKLEEYSQKMLKLGFDNEATSQSVSKLLLITGDYNQALALNNLAADLARNKNISLEQATTSLAQVLQGAGGKALVQYGLSFKDGASSAEILVQLQEKLKNSAIDFADSTGGKLETLNTQWGQIKEQIGDAVMPAVMAVVDAIQKNLPAIIENIKLAVDIFTSLAESVWTVASAIGEFTAKIPIISAAIDTLSNSVKVAKMGIDGLALGYRMVTGTQDSYTDSQVKLSKSTEDLIKIWNQLHPNAKITTDEFKQMDLEQQSNITGTVLMSSKYKELSNALKEAEDPAKSTTAALAGISGKAGTISGDVGKLKDEYKTMTASVLSNLTDLQTSHQAKMTSIADSIASVQKQMSKLSASYSKAQTDDTASVADQIVASQNKVASLKDQLSKATTATQRADLQKQLDAEQKNLDSSAGFAAKNQKAITEAQRRAGLTELQRSIEDYNNRRAIATQEFNDQMLDLQNQLKAKRQEQKDEIAITKAKAEAIVDILISGNAAFKKASDERQAITKAEVDAEISYYKALQQAISAVKSSTSIAGVSNAGSKLSGARADGGSVNSGEAYLVGERGPEIFVPGSNGGIIPNSGVGGGNVTININGGQFMDERQARRMGDLIISQFRRLTRA